MKAIRIIQSALTAMLFVSMLGFFSCGGDDPGTTQTKQEEVTAMLVGKTWKMQSVSVDAVDKSSLFAGMAIAFTGTSMTITNPGPVWAGVTSWTFTSADAVAFRRNDNVEVQIQVTDTSLKLTLPWTKTTLGPGRAGSVAGTHVFTFGL